MMEVYLDNSATTMCYPEVGELVYHIMCRDYGNPSAMYRKGMEAERYIKEAKETISKLLKVNAKEIIFTSGGTESDNLALIGAAKANRRAGNHLIASGIEHPAIINTMRYLEEEGQYVAVYAEAEESWDGTPLYFTQTDIPSIWTQKQRLIQCWTVCWKAQAVPLRISAIIIFQGRFALMEIWNQLLLWGFFRICLRSGLLPSEILRWTEQEHCF